MILLTFAALVTLLWVIAALLVWPVLRIVRGPKQLRGVARWSFRSWLAGLPVSIFLLLPILLSWLISGAGTRPGDEVRVEAVEACGSPFEEALFSAADGVEVGGWFLPGQEGIIPVAVTHGLFRSRMEVVDLACALNAEGHPVLAFDLRNHGQSGRRSTTIGYQERLDVEAAIEWIRQKTGYARPAVLGISMGAAASLLAAAERPETVSAIIADSPFISLRTTVSRHVGLFLGMPSFPFANVFTWNLSRIGGFDPDRLDLTQELRETTLPILLIYGEKDSRMPPEQASQLHTALPGTDKQLLLFPNAGHGHAYDEDPGRYLAAVNSLLARVSTCP